MHLDKTEEGIALTIEAIGIDRECMDNMDIIRRFFSLGIQGKTKDIEKLYKVMKETGYFNAVII